MTKRERANGKPCLMDLPKGIGSKKILFIERNLIALNDSTTESEEKSVDRDELLAELEVLK